MDLKNYFKFDEIQKRIDELEQENVLLQSKLKEAEKFVDAIEKAVDNYRKATTPSIMVNGSDDMVMVTSPKKKRGRPKWTEAEHQASRERQAKIKEFLAMEEKGPATLSEEEEIKRTRMAQEISGSDLFAKKETETEEK